MNIDEFENEIRAGIISEKGFQKLWDAECYGTAAPMQWLGARLKILYSVITSGGLIEIKNESGNQFLTNESQFYAWCKQALPDAYVSFFEGNKI